MRSEHTKESNSHGHTLPDRRTHPSATAGRGRPTEQPSDQSASSESGGFSRILRTLPATLALTAAVGLLLVTAATVIAYRSPDPSALTLPLSYGVLGLLALIGGFIAGRRAGEDSMSAGLTAGTALAVVLLLAAWLLPGEGTSPVICFLTRVAVIPLHLLGARLARPRQKAAAHPSSGHSSHRR